MNISPTDLALTPNFFTMPPCREPGQANELAWKANWRGIMDYLRQNGHSDFADRLNRRLVDLDDLFSPSLRTFPGHQPSLLQAQQSLGDLAYRIQYPDTPLKRKVDAIRTFLSDTASSRRMDTLATSLLVAADYLACGQGGWQETKATLIQDIARTEAKIHVVSLLPESPLQTSSQQAVLGMPVTNEILNLLPEKYGLRKIPQVPTGHTDKDALARDEKEKWNALVPLDAQAEQALKALAAPAALRALKAMEVMRVNAARNNLELLSHHMPKARAAWAKLATMKAPDQTQAQKLIAKLETPSSRKLRQALEALEDVPTRKIASYRTAAGRATKLRLALQTAYDETTKSLDACFTPASMSASLARHAMNHFRDRIAPRVQAGDTARQALVEDAAKAVSKQMFGDEHVLKPAAFVQEGIDLAALGSDLSLLKFDVLSYMHEVHDLQGELKTIGSAGQEGSAPYRLVTDTHTVWKVPLDKDTSWTALKRVPVARPTWAEFCAAVHPPQDPAIDYRKIISGLLSQSLGEEDILDPQAPPLLSLERLSTLLSLQSADDKARLLEDLPASFFEHPSIVQYLVGNLSAFTLRNNLDLYFRHIANGLQRSDASGAEAFLAALKRIGRRLEPAALLNFSPRPLRPAGLASILEYLESHKFAAAYVFRYKNEIEALRAAAPDQA